MSFDTFIASFKRLRAGIHLDPERDWLVLITLSLIIFAVIVTWNVSTFGTIASGGTIGTPSSTATPLFDRASLDTIHAIFTDRAAEEAKYQTGAYRFSDPSQ